MRPQRRRGVRERCRHQPGQHTLSGQGPLGGAAVTGDGNTQYVIDSKGGGVAVFDTATNTEIANLLIGAITGGVTVSPVGTQAYVTSSDNTVTTITRGGTTEACTESLCLPIPGR